MIEGDVNPDQFYCDHRKDLTAYAATLADNMADAEDAVAEATMKSYIHYMKYGIICPAGRDPVGWMKVVIHHYICDLRRRHKVAEKNRHRSCPPPPGGGHDDVIDDIIASQGWSFIRSLAPRQRDIALLRWGTGLRPPVIVNESLA